MVIFRFAGPFWAEYGWTMQQGKTFLWSLRRLAGKTTLVAALLAADQQIKLSVSHTTRAPREGEVDGKNYHFVSRETFISMLQRSEFLESAEVYGNSTAPRSCGFSNSWMRAMTSCWKSTGRARKVRKLFPQAIGVFILPPSLPVLEQRLRGRGTDSEESIAKRMASAREEITRG